MWRNARRAEAATPPAANEERIEVATDDLDFVIEEQAQDPADSPVIAAVLRLNAVVQATAEKRILEKYGETGRLLISLAKHLCLRDRPGGDPDGVCLGVVGAEPMRDAKGTIAFMGPIQTAWECYLPEAVNALELVKMEATTVVKFLEETVRQ